MNRIIFLFLIVYLTFFGSSCNRKAIHKIQPDFIGRWHHKETNGENWYIDMDEKSWGVISVYDADGNYSDENKYGENPHRWRYNTKRKELTHGIISEKFKVNQLPSIAETTIINGFDTIQTGESYFIMNDDYYIKLK